VLGNSTPRVELIGLKQPITSASRIAVLLVFNNAGKIWRDVRVEAASPVAESHGIEQ
jgi:hypothetical protein